MISGSDRLRLKPTYREHRQIAGTLVGLEDEVDTREHPRRQARGLVGGLAVLGRGGRGPGDGDVRIVDVRIVGDRLLVLGEVPDPDAADPADRLQRVWVFTPGGSGS